MAKGITYDQNTLNYMRVFERVAKTRLIDCFEDKKGVLNFFVPQKDIGKAIGKNAVNAKKISEMLNKKIKIVAFNKDLKTFLNNLLFPNVVEKIGIDEENNTVILKDRDFQKKSLIIGKRAINLRNYEFIVQRFFPEIKEIKVE